MRNSFVRALVDAAMLDNSIFLICGDLGYSVLEPFEDLYPDRFLNIGVAEQNMMGVAAGLSMEGYNVFTYSIGNFPTLRCMEQIRYDIAYHRANVKIVAVGGGYAYGPLGVSHHTTEEIGMLRTIPNLTVTCPGDPLEAASVTSYLATYHGPAYMRINKAGEKNVHQRLPVISGPSAFLIGEENQNSEIAVLCCGDILGYAHSWIVANNVICKLYSFPFVSPLCDETLIYIARTTKKIITMEEHQRNGGFGSAVVEALNDLYSVGKINRMPIVQRVAIDNKFISFAGSQQYLRGSANLELSMDFFTI